MPKISFSRPKFSWPRFNEWKFPHFDFQSLWQNEKLKKNLILVLSLISFLIIGALFSLKEEATSQTKMRAQFLEIQNKVLEAQGQLSANRQDKANSAFKQAYKEILPLAKGNTLLAKDAITLKGTIEQNLAVLNRIEDIKDPKIAFDFNNEGFVPQRLSLYSGSLFFYSPYEKTLFKLSLGSGKSEKINLEKGVSFASGDNTSIYFFVAPDKILPYRNGKFGDRITIKLIGSKTQFSGLASLEGSLYFLEKDTNEVIKYASPLSENYKNPYKWIFPTQKKPRQAKAIEVTDKISLLSSDNTLWQYQQGRFEKTISFDIFPLLERLTKVSASPLFDKLVLLEPSQKRVVVVDSSGLVLKQFKSEKFNNLKDVVFSPDGKFLYILNGLVVYKVSIF